MSAAQVRHGLRRLLRVARRLDGDRTMLRALLPVAGAHLPSLPGDDDAEEEHDTHTVRGVVMRAVREAGGVAARPEGVRAMSRNAAALEAVIARADLATAAERVFLESASAPETRVAASNASPVRFGSVDVASDERSARLRSWRHLKDVLHEHPEVAHRIARARRPGTDAAAADDAMRPVRAAVDFSLARASSQTRLEDDGGRGDEPGDEPGDDDGAAWLRRASWETLVSRRDRARRRAEAREIARRDPVELWTSRLHLGADDDDDLDDLDDVDGDLSHPNAAFYRSRLDAVLEDPGGDVLALFREMHDVGCPPSRRLYVDAMRKRRSPETTLRLLWMLAHRSGEASEAALRATPLGVSGVFSFQSARGRHPGGGTPARRHTRTVGVAQLCERVADAVCQSLLEAADDILDPSVDAGSVERGTRGHARGHERALAAMGAMTDLGAAPGSRVANSVLTRCALAFAAHSCHVPTMTTAVRSDPDDEKDPDDARARFLLRRIMDAATRAERHGTRLEASTWHALIGFAERRGSLGDFFATCDAFAARGGSVGAETVASLLEWAREVGDEAVAGWAEHELWSTGKGAFLAHLNRPTC